VSSDLNLSRSPFLNPRPVLRLTILLWTLGLIVAALNVRLYWSHFSGSSETREQEQRLTAEIASEEAQVKKLQTTLASYDLEWQNDQSAFLNHKISERSFSWSQLFDRLGEVLPADARVASLSPEFSSSRRRRGETAENEVELGIRGIAKDSAVLLEFVDALFGHPSFRNPNLSSESVQDGGMLDFNLSVIYEARPPEPEVPEELLAEETAEGAEPGAAELAAAEDDEAPLPDEEGGAAVEAAEEASETDEPAEDSTREATTQ
jgi:Tfp pilus assembly protein PilN